MLFIICFLPCILFSSSGVSSAFASLLREVRHSQRHAFSEGSHSNLRTQFRSYFGFCIYFDRIPLPADLDTICGYVQFLSRSVQHPTIRNYLSGVKMLHILTGFPYPFTGNAILRLVLRGIHRLHPYTPIRAPPVTPDILQMLFRVVDQRDSLESSVFACALFLFFTMSRLGSMLPASNKTKADHFLVADRVVSFASGLFVTFLHTKTIQFGERVRCIPLIRTDSPLCPVAAYCHARSFMAHLDLQLPAFCFRTASGDISPLFSAKFVSVIRLLFQKAGIADALLFRGHSFRRGGASWAFNRGIPGELIQVMGDWSSDAYKVYLEFSMDSRVFLAQHLALELPR